MKESTITRRNFVTAAAVAGAALAAGSLLDSCAPKTTTKESSDTDEDGTGEIDTRPYDQTKVDFYTTICHGCIANCAVKAYVQDGVVVKLEGHPDSPLSQGSICMKCLNQLHTVYSPRRILYPMKRTGAKGAANAKWERMNWDDACEEVAQRIFESMQQYGTYSIFASAGGGGSYVGSAIPPAAMMSILAPNGFEPGASQCWMPRTSMAKYMYGGADQSMADSSVKEIWKGLSEADQEAGITGSTDTIVLWGTQPSCSQTAQAGRGLAELRERGLKTIVVDPNFSADAAKATVHLPLRPGSDVGLINAWFRYIFENKLYDEQFCKYWTNLPFLIDPDTKLPVLASELFSDFKQTTPEDTPAYVCYDLKTNAVAPFEYSSPENSTVNPEIFWSGEYKGKKYSTAGQIYKDEVEPWTLDRAEKFTWVPKDRIEEALKIYTGPAQLGKMAGIAHGVATDQQEISSQATLGLLGLDMVMGYVNKPGATLTQNFGGAAFGGGGGPTLGLEGANEWGKCYADGVQSRPTSSYVDNNYGYVVGASESTNKKRIEEADQQSLEIAAQIWKDRIGQSQFRGLGAWSMCSIPMIREAIETGKPYQPHVWLEWSGNKLAVIGSSAAWYSAAQKLDYIVGEQPLLTSFHEELADMVFPTEEWLEDVGANSSQLNYSFANPQIIHLGESVTPMEPYNDYLNIVYDKVNADPDSIVFTGMNKTVKELGVQFPFTAIFAPFPSTDEIGWQQQVSSMAETLGISPDATKEEYMEALKNNPKGYSVSTPSDEYWTYGQHLTLADDGLPMGFGTESRKCEVYCTLLIKLGRTGWPYMWPNGFDQPADSRITLYDGDYCPIARVPKQKEAPQVDGFDDYIESYDSDFPFALTSGRVTHFHHGTMRHAAFARELYPAPFIEINPKDAEELGISQGDWVEISSRRTVGDDYDVNNSGVEMALNHEKSHNTKVGDPIHAIAYVTNRIAPKVVWMERFWNPECYDKSVDQSKRTGGWAECGVNVLTNAIDTNFNEVFGSYTYRGIAVNVKKSDRPEFVWTQPEQFEPFMPTTANQVIDEVGVLRDNASLIQDAPHVASAPTSAGSGMPM